MAARRRPRAPQFRIPRAALLLALAVVCAVGCANVTKARPVAESGHERHVAYAAPVIDLAPVPKAQLGPHVDGGCAAPPDGFSCTMQQRISEVMQYIAGQPGTIGIVLHDRDNGATWENANARTDMPAASTVKLAMVLDLLLRNQAGSIDLDGYDWYLIDQALHESSDVAADQLWFSFEDDSFLQRIQQFGMHTASFTTSPGYWGFMYCSARDLDNLMNYILSDAPASDRDFIVDHLQHVAPIQQWGVWGAGPSNQPGNKDGWEDDGGVWITNTVGFAGPHELYTLAIMDDLGGAADFHQGSTTLSEISALLFRGHFGPAPTVEATP